MWNIGPIQIQIIMRKTGHEKERSLMEEGGKRRKLGR
jgi:hypothetical protein